MFLTEHHERIRECYRLAASSVARGNHPFGALLAVGGKVVLRAENTIESTFDITAHAELNLVRLAYRELGKQSLEASTLYSSTEPCAMCAGAIFWAHIPTVVYGCSAAGLGEIAGETMLLGCGDVVASRTRRVRVLGPILEEEGLAQHRSFW